MRSPLLEPLGALLGWLCPPRCAACDAPLLEGEPPFCPVCDAALEPLAGSACRVPSRWPRPGCERCQGVLPPCRVTSRFAYGGALSRSLRRYKYAGRLDLARPLGALLSPEGIDPAARLVPIPSSRRALRARGFDPVLELLRAAPGARGRWIRLLDRVDDREAQAGLPARERRRLGPEAFRVRRPLPAPDQALVLVDDVFTTGATLRAAAAALRGAGAGPLRALTLARSEAGAR